QEASPAIVEPLRIELPFLEDQFQEDPLVDPPEVLMDSLNSAAGGKFLDKMPRECLKIIKSKSKVRQSRAKAVVAKVSTSSSTSAISFEVSELKDLVRALLLDKKNQSSASASSSTHAPVKAIEPGGNFNQGQLHRPQVNQPPAYQAPAYQAPIPQTQSVTQTDFVSYIKANDTVLRNMQSQGQNVQNQCQGLQTQIANLTDMLSKFMSSNTASSAGSGTLYSNTVTNPKKDLKEMSFEISFTDALILMPKFASTLKALIGNKEKLSKMARTSMSGHCLAVILNKLPRKLGDPGKFLIPCEFLGMDECLALADLDASINLMPLSVWEGLLLLELTPTYMTLELADRSVFKPIGIAKDVSVKVGVFHFPADFVVVDFKPDPRVPLILGRCFLKTGQDLIDVHKGELTLRIGNEAITYNLDHTVRYSANYNQMTANKMDVIYEMYSQEVLGFSDVTVSGNPTPYDDPIVSTTSPTLTPFGDSNFLLFEEADAFLVLGDDPDSPNINPFYYDPKGGILLLEAIFNSEPLPPLPNQKQYMPSYKKELKVCEAKTVKSSVDEPPEVELKDLPPHLEYAFLKGDNKLPIIIAKKLRDEEKSALLKVLKSHKRAIAWKLSDIQGINPEFCTHKILMEEDYKPAVQHQRRVNPKIHDVIKKEVEKLLDARLIYLISDSPWVSSIHCVPKKGGFTVVENEENELIPTRLVTRWRVCIDYRKLNEATRKDHFPFPFMDQMLKRLAGNEYYCFLDVFFGLYQSFPNVKEKTHESSNLDSLNRDLPFELMCDASNFAIGVVLGQRHEKHFKPIHYASKTMNDVKSNYTTTEKEMLVVVYAFKKFRSYLIMNKSIVHTNHSALKYLFAKKDAKARLLRWVLLLQEFDFKVLDTKGAENLAVGHLAPWYADFANYHAGNFIVKDDALWAFRTAYKTPIGYTPYKLVYEKACHLPIKLEHKAYWALKQAKFDLAVAGDHRKVQLNELRDHAYKNSLIYKEKRRESMTPRSKTAFSTLVIESFSLIQD
nr:DNA-directed DNA polymerase [Tanacetum cinerariifolium]